MDHTRFSTPDSVRSRARRGARHLATTATVGAGVSAAALGWAYLEHRWPVIRRYEVAVPASPGRGEITILHLSDLHLYPGQEWMVEFLEEVSREDFDVVVSTGDNFSSGDALDILERAYRPLLDHPGVFVLGSNDYYSPLRKPWARYLFHGDGTPQVDGDDPARTAAGGGSPGGSPSGSSPGSFPGDAPATSGRTVPDLPWVDFVHNLARHGWIDLSNRAAAQSIGLRTGEGEQLIAWRGVDDPHLNRDRMPAPPPEWGRAGALSIGVAHAPYRRVLDAFTSEGADLILAGHTHGGQVRVPGVGALVTNCDLPRSMASGVHTWTVAGHSSRLHVSAGLGTTQFAPIRFACRPEVSLLRIVPAR